MTDSKNTIGRRAMRRKNTVGIITFLCLLAYRARFGTSGKG